MYAVYVFYASILCMYSMHVFYICILCLYSDPPARLEIIFASAATMFRVRVFLFDVVLRFIFRFVRFIATIFLMMRVILRSDVVCYVVSPH